MNIIKQLLHNLLHPRKTAMYRLQRINRTIAYEFLLAFIMTCFLAPLSIKSFFVENPGLSKIFIPLLFIFYDFVYSCLLFIMIFLLSLVAWSMKILLHRRLTYPQLWSITANAITYPVVFLALAQTLISLPAAFISLFVVTTAAFQFLQIHAVPKPKNRQNKSPAAFIKK